MLRFRDSAFIICTIHASVQFEFRQILTKMIGLLSYICISMLLQSQHACTVSITVVYHPSVLNNF